MEVIPQTENKVESLEIELERVQKAFGEEARRLEANLQAMEGEEDPSVLSKLSDAFYETQARVMTLVEDWAVPAGVGVAGIAAAYPALKFFLTGEYGGDVFEMAFDKYMERPIGTAAEAINASEGNAGKGAWSMGASLKNLALGGPVMAASMALRKGAQVVQSKLGK